MLLKWHEKQIPGKQPKIKIFTLSPVVQSYLLTKEKTQNKTKWTLLRTGKNLRKRKIPNMPVYH